ncbi:MAG TPA: zinc ribbon domain-containing protein [Thermoflexus sp.]|nr:zinc ribbon domain-containing protein [Thermoflexus sp.]
MPIYEYRCLQCRRRVTVFFRTFSEVDHSQVACDHCGSRNLVRLISRVRVLRSEESRLEALADADWIGDVDEKDPRSIGRWMRRMTQELGEELGDLGPEFEEVIERLEAGQSPEEIEKAMPELAGEGDEGAETEEEGSGGDVD